MTIDDEPKAARVKNPELFDDLLRRVNTDQKVRQEMAEFLSQNDSKGFIISDSLSADKYIEYQALGARIKNIDTNNRTWLKGIVKKHGWPTVASVGLKGAHAAWLLVQHARTDHKFQRQCLDMMTKLPKEEVPQTGLAYLTDQLLLHAEGKKQVYGTAFVFKNDQWEPYPIEDEENLDRRRANMGLPPMAEYILEVKERAKMNLPPRIIFK